MAGEEEEATHGELVELELLSVVVVLLGAAVVEDDV